MNHEDLRERVLEQYIKLGKGEHAPGGSQCVGPDWYAPKYGYDTLEHVLDALTSETGLADELMVLRSSADGKRQGDLQSCELCGDMHLCTHTEKAGGLRRTRVADILIDWAHKEGIEDIPRAGWFEDLAIDILKALAATPPGAQTPRTIEGRSSEIAFTDDEEAQTEGDAK